MKLVLGEPERGALRECLGEWDGYVSSALLGTESVRACARQGDTYAADAREWLGDIALLPLDDEVLGIAASLAPARLRTLDALHLATAMTVRGDIGAFVAYDDRLVEAADRHGLAVARPGR